MKIPYIAIEWADETKLTTKLQSIHDTIESDNDLIPLLPNQVNMHPPAHEIIRSIIDLIINYNWEFVTILYSGTRGPQRVQDLIKLPSSSMLKKNKKFRLQIRQLSTDASEWLYQLKEIKLSGSSHIVVDIEPHLFNEFVKKVNILNISYLNSNRVITVFTSKLVNFSKILRLCLFRSISDFVRYF